MKIYIGDHLGAHKTTIQMEKWFLSKGHEVHWDTYYENEKGPNGPGVSPHWIEWADIIIFEWLEGMVELCLKDGWGKKKPVYCRAMDIEVWAENANGADLTDLSGLAYTSKYIFDMYNREQHFTEKYPTIPTAHIPLSIDMNEWTFKEHGGGYNVAVIGHMWDSKGPNLIPHFVRHLIDKSGNKNWKFYIQGNWRHDVWRWYLDYTQHIIKEMGLQDNIFISEERVESMDKWMDDKDYLVTFSMKDAFSLIVGEAMAKGIKALPHNFAGSKDIWGKYVWTTFDDLYYKMVDQTYDSNEYRNYVNDHYSNEVIMPKWEQFCNIK